VIVLHEIKNFPMRGVFCYQAMNKYLKSLQKPANFALFLAFSLQSLAFQAPASMSLINPLLAVAYTGFLADDIEQTTLKSHFNDFDENETIIKVEMTGYSSTPDQTDDTPFITASGKHVHDGTIAANFLKFGTKIKIPELFGDKVFVVEDRMARRYFHRVDIWFPDRSMALKFGKREAEIVIVES